METIGYSLLATTFICLLSLTGIALYRFRRFSFILVSFAVGALLGDAFIHILPNNFNPYLIFFGLMIFFSVEKLIRWRHCHEPECEDNNPQHVVSLSLVGDSVHNFIDGMIIAAAFLTNTHLGLVTTLAVILHEIPQEIGDFAIYIHHGLSVKKALLNNLISSLFALVGCILGLIFSNIINLSQYILPMTAGGFIYLAASDLIPELHRHQSQIKHSLIQIITVILGFSLMSLLLLVE